MTITPLMPFKLDPLREDEPPRTGEGERASNPGLLLVEDSAFELSNSMPSRPPNGRKQDHRVKCRNMQL
eukprot:CAMPEP_0176187568 /NCGR_PEP_ID=MMETSP0121_2-20121125/2463_1 /TAXON_ID=160619 /ORGANISM="Kryptoperidinium foliaceum, Strain CCMP 1326" /LENGTH=68 /DNA_ID=CAMNT_0017526109 /DNA_START=589 /DNA_END=795 /DNA_ORIENTATION=+